MIKALFIILSASATLTALSQTAVNIQVDAGATTTLIPPVWRDHYENHLMDGYGSNPVYTGNHILYTTDPAFLSSMAELKPRFIRISIGRLDNPPDTNYFSMNPAILRNLKYEFYKGGNNMADADNLANYNFSYIDSAITLIKSFGAEPFITMDYMPFTLSRDSTPEYQAAIGLLYHLAYDNSVRNSPPANNAVYGRVMYHFIKHCYQNYGATYFEHWNEPDQQWLNPVAAKFFWKGNEYELYNAYAAIADEVSADTALAPYVKLGGCSFAFYSLLNTIPVNFLNEVSVNNKKFDFLSFHPYSDSQYKGGYDTAKVNIAMQWRNQYVPHAELINAEWGRLDPNTTVWGDLDYGLDKFSHIIDMLDKGIVMSHNVCLFDAEASTDNFSSLGMFRVGPIVPKPSAFVFYNLNKLNDALNRIPLSINSGMAALAGRTNNSSKIVIAFPAEKPAVDSNTVILSVSNLPWGNAGYYLYRYELTEQSYTNGVIYNLTHSHYGSGSTAADTFSYTSVNNSGCLVVWEITSSPILTVRDNYSTDSRFIISPNPNNGQFHIKSLNDNMLIQGVKIYDMEGRELTKEVHSGFSAQIELQVKPQAGIYFVVIETDSGLYRTKLFIH